MNGYLNNILLFAKRMLIIVGLMTITRMLFYIYNVDYLDVHSFWEFVSLHFYGIRFDFSAIFYYTILFILLSLIPGNFKNLKVYQTVLKILFVVFAFLLILLNLIDVQFFEFENRRMTADIFSSEWLGEDFITLLPQFIKDFWYIVLFMIVALFLLVKFFPKQKKAILYTEAYSLNSLVISILLFVVVLGVCFLGGRGGFQMKPLRVNHAAIYTSAQNIPLVLNTPFTIMKTVGKEGANILTYFDEDDLEMFYSPVQSYESQEISEKNVVLIILESFSKEYIGAMNNNVGYTPFIDSLIQKSLVFEQCYANAKRSIESLPSIIAGIPHLFDNAYITSPFSTNRIHSIPETLKKYGYHTAFFHGGKNGTMGFDQFANIAGFDEYYGMTEYGSENGYDGNWGIFDEEFYEFFNQELSNFSEPFLGCIYTLSSHHPYEIPEKYKGVFPEGELNIHQSIRYADYALQTFFEKARNTHWFENTVFVITSDHTAQAIHPFYKNKVGMYAIPLIFYDPSNQSLIGRSRTITQQTDIFPSIIDYLNIPDTILCYGNSAFKDSTQHFSVNFINGIYQLIEDDHTLLFDGSKVLGFYDLVNDSLLRNNILDCDQKNEMVNKLKAIIQSFQFRVKHNNLYIPEK